MGSHLPPGGAFSMLNPTSDRPIFAWNIPQAGWNFRYQRPRLKFVAQEFHHESA
jgi:hypothetical protein